MNETRIETDEEYAKRWTDRWAKEEEAERIRKQRPQEPLIDPNRFPEGSDERELKAAYLADEAARKETKKYPW